MRKIDFEFAPRTWQTNIGLIDDTYKSLVFDDGSLAINWEGDGATEFTIEGIQEWPASNMASLTNARRFFHHTIKPVFTHFDKVVSFEQDLLSVKTPIMVSKTHCEKSNFTTKIFAYQKGKLRADIILWEIEALSGFGEAPTKVELSIDGDRNTLPPIYQNIENDERWMRSGLELLGISQSKFLQVGETRKGVFVVVHRGDFEPEEATIEFGEKALEEMTTYWEEQTYFANEFEVPDPQINDFLTACSRNILQAREEKDEVLEYQVGPTIYRGLWIVDGYFLLDAANIMTNDERIFEQGVLSTLRRVKPCGSVRIIANHEKETGISIATLIRLCEVFNKDERMKELWPTILRAVDFLEGLMDKANAMGPDYIGHKMFPPMFADGGIDGLFPEFTTTFWNLFGLRKAAYTAKRLDLEGKEKIQSLYERLYKGMVETAEENMRKTESGIDFIPQNLEHREGYDHAQSATWAFCHAIYPGEVLESDHKFVKNLLALFEDVDDEQGIPKLTGWIHSQAIWPYASMFNAEVFLYSGNKEKALDYLYAFANHASPTMVWREEQSLTHTAANEQCGDMPHNWGSAEFIRLVRNMAVFETEDNLALLKGLNAEWLPEDGQKFSIQKTPTKYGLISVKVEPHAGDYMVTYSIETGNQQPEKVILHWLDQEIELKEPIGSLILSK